VTDGWAVATDEEEDEPIVMAKYTPPIAVVDKTSAYRVLFVKDAAPLGQFPGGDAYAWKAPSLREGFYVLTCRAGECMAVAQHGNFMLRKVGILANPKETEHMGTYVCEPVTSPSPSKDRVWRALRLAKSSERLFTFEECFAAEYPHTQITRGGMVKLLGQISPGSVGSRAPVYVAKHAPAPRPKPKFKPAADEDGWTPAPASAPSSSTALPAPPKKRAEAQRKSVVPEEKNAFWALRDDEEDVWCATSKKK
jgi:hypothetical protein